MKIMQTVSMVKRYVTGITQFCEILIEKVAFLFQKKVNHSVNGKTHKTDLSVACFNDSREGTKNLHFRELIFKNLAAGSC